MTTYAELWADRINATYDSEGIDLSIVTDASRGEECNDDTIRRVLNKAAVCLRDGESATFTGPELDLVRHLMPAHVVHQSIARRWWHQNHGAIETA